jgi:hypothetical protein
MEIISKRLPADCTIIDTGDWHIGALNCHLDGIQKLIATIEANPNTYVILKGDLIEAIAPNDKRFVHCSQDVGFRTAHEQVDFLVSLLEPIRDNILAMMLGNHEYKLINVFDVAKHICQDLGIPYGGYACVIQNIGCFKMFCTHGYGSITSNAKDQLQRLANKQSSLKLKLEKSKMVDCVYMSMGHIHHGIIAHPTIGQEIMLTTTAKKIKQTYRQHTDQNANYIPPEARWYVATPSMLKLYSEPGMFAISYAEMAGYEPTELGWVEIDVRDDEITDVRKVVV